MGYSFEEVGARIKQRNPEQITLENYSDYEVGQALLILYPEYSVSLNLSPDPAHTIDPVLKSTLLSMTSRSVKDTGPVEGQEFDWEATGAFALLLFLVVLGLVVIWKIYPIMATIVKSIIRLVIKAYHRLDRALDLPDKKGNDETND